MTLSIARTDRPSLVVLMGSEISPQRSATGQGGDSLEVVARVRQSELERARRERAELRSNHLYSGGNLGAFAVALEIDVLIADEASVARAEICCLGEGLTGETARYVGTAGGLVTLIRDIYAAEVADAVIVYAIGGVHTVSLLDSHVLPAFSH